VKIFAILGKVRHTQSVSGLNLTVVKHQDHSSDLTVVVRTGHDLVCSELGLTEAL
jgi:hypothetical protein